MAMATRASADPNDGAGDRLDRAIPGAPAVPYDMNDVINDIVDMDSFLEIQPDWAQNIIIGFARLGGQSVGIVAQQVDRLGEGRSTDIIEGCGDHWGACCTAAQIRGGVSGMSRCLIPNGDKASSTA